MLELAFNHGLDGPELADALGVSPTNANTLVHRLRGTIERSLGALLVSRRVRNNGGCPELAAILDGWDGDFNVLMRKRISRHIESCETCDEERRRLVSPVALLGAAPVFIPAPQWLRDRTLTEVDLTSASKSMDTGSQGGRTGHDRSSVWPATAFVAALIATLGLTLVWLNQNNVSITPTEVSQSVPASAHPRHRRASHLPHPHLSRNPSPPRRRPNGPPPSSRRRPRRRRPLRCPSPLHRHRRCHQFSSRRCRRCPSRRCGLLPVGRSGRRPIGHLLRRAEATSPGPATLTGPNPDRPCSTIQCP